MLQVQCEMLEAKFAHNQGVASAKDLDLYGRTSGQLRRVIETLNLHTGRKPREIDATSDPAYQVFLEAYNAPDPP